MLLLKYRVIDVITQNMRKEKIMGYTTDFAGHIDIVPALNKEEIKYINKFSDTRRMNRKNGPYYIDGGGFAGQDDEGDIIDYNKPHESQPGLWCQWVVSEDGKQLSWNGGEKFYHSPEWMTYLIEHFLGKTPIAKEAAQLDFLKGHTLNGEIAARGEEPSDIWLLVVKDNKVSVMQGEVKYA